MLDFEMNRPWIGMVVIVLLAGITWVFFQRHRKRHALKMKQEQILRARRRDVQKWNALQKQHEERLQAEQESNEA